MDIDCRGCGYRHPNTMSCAAARAQRCMQVGLPELPPAAVAAVPQPPDGNVDIGSAAYWKAKYEAMVAQSRERVRRHREKAAANRPQPTSSK